MTEYPSQSHAQREPREVEPAVITPGRVRKASMGRRFREAFFEGSPEDVWGEMFWNTFVRGLADNFSDMLHAGVDTLFRGQGGYRPGVRARSRAGSSISRYNPDSALGTRNSGPTPERMSAEARSRQDTGTIALDSRAEAEEVLRKMNLLIDQYDSVTLADFYQLVRISPQHTDYKWGWTDIGGAAIQHHRGDYYLDLPQPVVLK